MRWSTTKKVLDRYSHDRSPFHAHPQKIAFPRTEQDIKDILHVAYKNKIPVTARGGGTGLSGAGTGNGIIIDTQKLNKIIKTGTMTTVEAGCLLKILRPKLKRVMIPSVPIHGDCTIGGMINTRSLGPKTVKYGPHELRVVSLRGVLADGQILDTAQNIPPPIVQKLRTLQREIKQHNVYSYIKKRPSIAGGYNLQSFCTAKSAKEMLHSLIVGSTGTLLVLSRITLCLPPKKDIKQLHILYFDSVKNLKKNLLVIKKNNPTVLEYANTEVLKVWDKEYRNNMPIRNNAHALIVGFEKKVKLKNTVQAKLVTKRKKFWAMRRDTLNLLEQKAKRKKSHILTGLDDITFHPKDAAWVVENIEDFFKKKKVKAALYGHIGVGSLHCRAFMKKRKPYTHDIFNILKKKNGTLIGEHNAGPLKSHYLLKESKAMVMFMKKIKRVFDPKNILNPHVLRLK